MSPQWIVWLLLVALELIAANCGSFSNNSNEPRSV